MWWFVEEVVVEGLFVEEEVDVGFFVFGGGCFENEVVVVGFVVELVVVCV